VSTASDLLNEPRPGINGVAYDTAWLAGVAKIGDAHASRFPTSLRWLMENQHADGSWGSSVRYEHDRILCTLAALAPLARFGHRAEDHRALEAGTRYLWQHGHLLRHELVELVGFELLLPTLVQRARAEGVLVPPQLDIYARERAQKLAREKKVAVELRSGERYFDDAPISLITARAPGSSSTRDRKNMAPQ